MGTGAGQVASLHDTLLTSTYAIDTATGGYRYCYPVVIGLKGENSCLHLLVWYVRDFVNGIGMNDLFFGRFVVCVQVQSKTVSVFLLIN
jgi:hypothetical protein